MKVQHMLALVLVAAICTSGCAYPGLVVGASGLRSQEGYQLYGRGQVCTNATWIVTAAERIQPLVAAEAARAGLPFHTPDRYPLCLVEQPQPCPLPRGPLARGCTGRLGLVLSRLWPPPPMAQSTTGLVEDLAHELVELQAWQARQDAHHPPWNAVSRTVVQQATALGLKAP